MYIVKVLIEYQNISLDKTFDYYYVSKIPLYTRVKVLFNRKIVTGFVIDVLDFYQTDYSIKKIVEVVDQKPIINDELYNVANYLKETYIVSMIQSLKTILPAGLKPKSSDKKIINKELFLEVCDSNQVISFKQQEVLESIKLEHNLSRKFLTNKYGIYSIDLLVKKQYLKKIMKDKNHIIVDQLQIELPKLNVKQDEIYKQIINGKDMTYLLHGITGSGKTLIYLHLAKYYLKQDKSVLVLVPEITLTLMVQEKFAQIFSNEIAILHSRLTNNQRFQEYQKIIDNKVKLVVGTRSSIFAPLTNIGLIIIDEEHDSSYKQSTGLMYNTIDVALFRANYNNAKLLLASATPSIESLTRAYKKKYKYLVLNKRFNNMSLPKMNIVDLNFEPLNSVVSKKTMSKIITYLDNNKQVIILLNRRGYNTLISCKDCQKTFMCPNCNVALTYHNKSNMLKCHHCHYQKDFDHSCLYCGSKNLKKLGTGIQKIEEYLVEELSKYVIIRIDQDTSNNVNALKKQITLFNDYKAQVLIGTQMIAKGLDFAKVDLVVILNIDSSLAINNYNANENAYQLIVQVAGRAGRFSGNGEVFLETWQPNHYVIEKALQNDYLGFYELEMKERKKYENPPYYKIALLTLSSEDEEYLNNEAFTLCDYLKDELKNVIIYDNQPAAIYKLANIYRQQIIIKYKVMDDELKSILYNVKKLYSSKKKITLTLNLNY